jgi:hypothetical protein
MDHIPDVSDAAYPMDQVPLLIEDVDLYDGPDLSSFPQRKGFTSGEQLLKLPRERRMLYAITQEAKCLSSRRKGSIIQSWLFMGPLVEVFKVVGIDIDFSDFVHDRRWITTRALESYVQRWENCENHRGAEERESHGLQIDQFLQLTERYAHFTLRANKTYRNIWNLPAEVALSIQLLEEALRNAWASIYHGSGFGLETGGGLLSDLPEDRMQEQGWCPSEVAMIQHNFSVTGRYFASRLRRQRSQMDHSVCSESKCYASQIDDTTYETKHAAFNCQCNHLALDSACITSILEAGHTPRVQVSQNSLDGSLSLRSTTTGDYVAISHVWAHGLGNVKANALPRCQLERLCSHVGTLHGQQSVASRSELTFWIDTLCVPIDRHGRKLALKNMRRTYVEAERVLVLDEELCQAPGLSSPEEVCIRIIFSAWSRRLWTFEEGMVSWDKLSIQFRDGPLDFSTLKRASQTQLGSMASTLRLECLSEAKRCLPRLSDFEGAKTDLVAGITDACKYRTTSRLSDETFCLASVAGLHLDNILEATSPADRMRLFLLQLHDLPADIIFGVTPKLQIQGFRWAPTSFLYPVASSTVMGASDDMRAVCTESGLLASWPGFALELSAIGEANDDIQLYYFRTEDNWVMITLPDLIQRDLHGRAPDTARLGLWQQLRTIPYPALIMLGAEPWEEKGAIVSIEKQDCGNLTAIFVGPVVFRQTLLDEDLFDPARLDAVKGMEIKGTRLPTSTRWKLT